MTKAPLIIGPDEVAGLVGCSTRSVRRLRAAKAFPAPLRLFGPTCKPRWRRADIEQWVREQAGVPEAAQPGITQGE